MRSQVNEYGITFPDWLAAAGYEETAMRLLEAWQKGEDPTDHAVDNQRARTLRGSVLQQLDVVADELDTTSEHRFGSVIRAIARELRNGGKS